MKYGQTHKHSTHRHGAGHEVDLGESSRARRAVAHERCAVLHGQPVRPTLIFAPWRTAQAGNFDLFPRFQVNTSKLCCLLQWKCRLALIPDGILYHVQQI